MSELCKINVSMLKSYENDFNKEQSNFNTRTYSTFSSSYLKSCSDPYVSRMAGKLQALYDKLKIGYQNTDKWWTDYNDNIEALENYLSDNGSVGAIKESSVRNSANKLPNLKKYNLKFAGIIPASMVGASYNTIFTNNAVVSTVDPFSSLYSDYRISEVNASEVVNNDNIVDQIDEAISTASASVVSWVKNIGLSIKDFFVSTGAKISSFGETVVSKDSEVIEDVDNFFDETKAYIANKAESLWDKTTEWWNDTTQKVDNWFDEVGTNISNGAKSLWADVTDWWSDVEDWWNDDALPAIKTAANTVWGVIKSVGATVAVFVQSLVEGILQFAEAIIDFVALVGTGVASIVTGLYDGGQAIYGAITGNEWSSVTKQMWSGTMGFVSTQYVTGWFDSLYQDTGYGQWLANNAYGFDITRSIGTGIGYIAGVVILTIATFGAGSVVAAGGSVTASTAAAATTATQMAVTATAAGIGRGTQNAWADGADLLEGLTAGTLTGLWEGLQFYIGGKISGLNLFGTDGILKSIGSSGLGTKLLNGLARVVLDGADGGVEGFVLPLITSIYKDGYYDDNGNYIQFTEQDGFFERYLEGFDDNGGWSAVLTNAGIGAGASVLGEAFDLSKYFKNTKNMDIEISSETRSIITKLDETYTSKQLDEVIDILISKEKGVNGKVAGVQLFKILDYDSVPRLVSPEEFLKLSNDSSYGIIYRGISGEDALKHVEQFKNGDMYVGGGNAAARGTGIYAAYGEEAYENIAQVYASKGGTTSDGLVMEMLLSDDAKIIDFDTIQSEQWEVLDSMAKSFSKYDSLITDFDSLANNLSKITDSADLKKAQFILNTLSNTGYYAALRGFDAIDVIDKKYLVICNRGKIIMADAGLSIETSDVPNFEIFKSQYDTIDGDNTSINEFGEIIRNSTKDVTDVDISKIMDEVETEKLFDYDGSQPTVDLFATEKIVPEAEATFDMFANTDPVKQQEITDLKLEIQKEASSLDVLDPNFSRNADLLMKKAKLQEELVMFAHSQGMTFKEYIESCGKITQLDEATQTIVNQQARHIFEVAENAEPKISQMMRSLEVNGARLEGFNYRFKSEGNIARKIATKLNGSASIDAIGYYASNINDSLRYTLILDEKNYVNQMYDSLHKLINEGYQVRSINNSWGDSIYQGMNTSLVSPDGMVFELQFHTDASFKTKEFLNHQLYEIYRSPLADISQIKAAREIMEINQQMYVKTIDGMVNLTQFDIIDNATYKNYFDYNDFVSHYDSQIASWKANLSEKQKNLFHNYIFGLVQEPGNYAVVNGLERNTLIDTTNRTVTVQTTFARTRPDPISFEQFEQTYLPTEYEGRMITTMEDFIDMQHECFNELNAATSQMKLDEGTILYRGINLNAIESMTDVNGNSIGITNGDSLETIFNKIRAAGGEYTDKGFMSASPVPVGITTSKDIILKLKCKKGVSGVDLSAVGGFENEFLLTANQKFDVVGFGKEEICGVMKNVLYLVSK